MQRGQMNVRIHFGKHFLEIKLNNKVVQKQASCTLILTRLKCSLINLQRVVSHNLYPLIVLENLCKSGYFHIKNPYDVDLPRKTNWVKGVSYNLVLSLKWHIQDDPRHVQLLWNREMSQFSPQRRKRPNIWRLSES